MKIKLFVLFFVICHFFKAQTVTANYTVNSVVCLNTSNCFTDLSTSNGGPITYWSWSFGDGSTTCCTFPNPCHIYAWPGTFTVTLIVIDSTGNSDTVNHSITVNPLPMVACSANPDTISPSSITQLNSSVSGGTPTYSYSWTPNYAINCGTCPAPLADPTVSICYSITVTDANGCKDTCQICVVVDPSLDTKEYGNSDRLNFYPNPFSTTATLNTGKSFKDATLIIYNIHGEQVKQLKNISGTEIFFYRNDLSSGLYFLQLTQDNKIFATEKLVITDN
jgi:hypothetical protein